MSSPYGHETENRADSGDSTDSGTVHLLSQGRTCLSRGGEFFFDLLVRLGVGGVHTSWAGGIRFGCVIVGPLSNVLGRAESEAKEPDLSPL